MFFSAIFFFSSVGAIVLMVLFRMWEIRVGRLYVKEDNVPDRFFQIEEIENETERLFRIVNKFIFHIVTLALSHMIIFFRRLRDAAGVGLQKLSASLPEHLPHHRTGSSFFLKDITAHKEEMRKENGYHKE